MLDYILETEGRVERSGKSTSAELETAGIKEVFEHRHMAHTCLQRMTAAQEKPSVSKDSDDALEKYCIL